MLRGRPLLNNQERGWWKEKTNLNNSMGNVKFGSQSSEKAYLWWSVHFGPMKVNDLRGRPLMMAQNFFSRFSQGPPQIINGHFLMLFIPTTFEVRRT